ncbi:hypothetical protein VTH06DRAFT_4245 [Thermothelomyces fergusii]
MTLLSLTETMDSSLAPAAYAGTLLFVLHLLAEAHFFEMMSDLFEVYPLWGVVLGISFLFTSAKLVAFSSALARACLPVAAAGTSRLLARLSAAATRRATLVREAVVSASRGFVNALGSATAAAALSRALCRLLLLPLLPVGRPFARAILRRYAAWESWVLARLGDFADLVCVDKGGRIERRRVLRVRERQWSAQRSRLDQLNDLAARMARNAADAWRDARGWLGGEHDHLRPSAFAGRVAVAGPEQGPIPPLGLWFRLRHRIDLDVYRANQSIARLDAALERIRAAIDGLERQVAARSREIRAINDQVRECRQCARAAFVAASFVRPTQIANFCRQLPSCHWPADSPGPAAILPPSLSPSLSPPPPETPRSHRALLPPPPPSPTPGDLVAAAASTPTPVSQESRKRALLDQARKQKHAYLLAEQRVEAERREREDARLRAAHNEALRRLAARRRYRERHAVAAAVATPKAAVESALAAEETPLDGNTAIITTRRAAGPEPSLERQGDNAIADNDVPATCESEPPLEGTMTVADVFAADRPDEEPEPPREGKGRVEAREAAYKPETAAPHKPARPVTVASGSLAEALLPEAEQGAAQTKADPAAEEPKSPAERRVKADDETVAEEPESRTERKVKADKVNPIADKPKSPLERRVKADGEEDIAEEPGFPLETKVKADEEPIATGEPEPDVSSFSFSIEVGEKSDEAMVDVAFATAPTTTPEAESSHPEEEAMTMEVEPGTLAAEEPKTAVHIVPAQESEKAEVPPDLADTSMPEASFREEERGKTAAVAAQAAPFDDPMHVDLPRPREQQMVVTYQMAEQADRELSLALQAAIEEHDRQQAEAAELAQQEQQRQQHQQQREAENAAWMQELARIAQMAQATLQKSAQLAERWQEGAAAGGEQAPPFAQAAATTTPIEFAFTAEETGAAPTGIGVHAGLKEAKSRSRTSHCKGRPPRARRGRTRA